MAKKSDLLEQEMRINYPYGMWTCTDGEQILFNRKYQPLNDKERLVENIDKSKEIFFYDDGSCPWDGTRLFDEYKKKLEESNIKHSFKIKQVL